jgi:methylenetetrahydrofolate dehydrogenase (NADP+)/methenyltetrahydrofolate cyclohydrolase
MPADLLDGKALAAQLQAELREEVAHFKAAGGATPHLAAVLVGDDPASDVYVKSKRRGCERAGMASTLHRLPADAAQEELLKLVERLNADATVHGILVQLPLPPQIDALAVQDAVLPSKDVDCFHPENVGLLVQGRPRFKPCTPHGVQQLLLRSSVQTAGQHAVVLGRSEIVGKPMASLLMQRGPGGDATVTVCHSRTPNLTELTRQADILIAAIGRPKFVTAEMVKPGAAVIDVGINRTAEGLVGDVDFAAVRQVANKISPVPGGVGPLTVTMLLYNTLAAARNLAGGK